MKRKRSACKVRIDWETRVGIEMSEILKWIFRVEMCKLEYLQRQHKQKTYHMGLVTRVALEKSLQDVSDEQFRKHYPVPPAKPLSRFQPDVKMMHNSIFLAGKS